MRLSVCYPAICSELGTQEIVGLTIGLLAVRPKRRMERLSSRRQRLEKFGPAKALNAEKSSADVT